MSEHTQGNGVAWFALVIAILALIIGWIAFNRSGADLEQIIEQEVEEATVEIRTDLQQAEQKLRNETSEGLQNAADDVRSDEE